MSVTKDEALSQDRPFRPVAFVYGVTGGRHMQMFGAGVAINEAFSDFDVVAHFGFSGGSIVAALLSSEIQSSDENIKDG